MPSRVSRAWRASTASTLRRPLGIARKAGRVGRTGRVGGVGRVRRGGTVGGIGTVGAQSQGTAVEPILSCILDGDIVRRTADALME